MTMKNMNNNLKNIFIFLIIFFSLSYAQDKSVVDFQTGSLQTFVDVYRGNFSIFDKHQTDLDFVSLLFGGTTSPSSSFHVSVDNKIETLDQMQVEYALGNTLGSQIDGIFYAGEDRGIRVEVAYFALDLLNTGDLNSVGVVINLSNVSFSDNRKVGVKFMLDTDIGESRNDPLVYLPTGEKITNTTIYKSHIPKFLFFGRKNITEAKPIGFYLYPYVSDSLPSSITIANWRRIVEQKNNIIDPSFAYSRDSTKDVGVSIDFEDIHLNIEESKYVGFVISKQHGVVSPVLSEDSVSKGVFGDGRYEADRLLNQSTQATPVSRRHTVTNEKQMISNMIADVVADDNVWKYLYQLNWHIQQKDNDLDSFLINQPNTSNTNHTIYKKRFSEDL